MAAVTKRVLAGVFVCSGMLKVVGQESMRKSFAEWGYPDWFRVAIGFWEMEAGTLLWSSRLRTAGVAQLSLLMIGAVYTHVKTPRQRFRSIIPAGTLVAMMCCVRD